MCLYRFIYFSACQHQELTLFRPCEKALAHSAWRERQPRAAPEISNLPQSANLQSEPVDPVPEPVDPEPEPVDPSPLPARIFPHQRRRWYQEMMATAAASDSNQDVEKHTVQFSCPPGTTLTMDFMEADGKVKEIVAQFESFRGAKASEEHLSDHVGVHAESSAQNISSSGGATEHSSSAEPAMLSPATLDDPFVGGSSSTPRKPIPAHWVARAPTLKTAQRALEREARKHGSPIEGRLSVPTSPVKHGHAHRTSLPIALNTPIDSPARKPASPMERVFTDSPSSATKHLPRLTLKIPSNIPSPNSPSPKPGHGSRIPRVAHKGKENAATSPEKVTEMASVAMQTENTNDSETGCEFGPWTSVPCSFLSHLLVRAGFSDLKQATSSYATALSDQQIEALSSGYVSTYSKAKGKRPVKADSEDPPVLSPETPSVASSLRATAPEFHPAAVKVATDAPTEQQTSDQSTGQKKKKKKPTTRYKGKNKNNREATSDQAPALSSSPPQASATPASAVQSSASQAPTSQAPASQAPASQAPASQAPASQAPASQAPTSQALANPTSTIQASTTSASAIQASAIQASAIQASAIQASAIQASATPTPAIQASATPTPAIQGSTSSAIPASATPAPAIQDSTSSAVALAPTVAPSEATAIGEEGEASGTRPIPTGPRHKSGSHSKRRGYRSRPSTGSPEESRRPTGTISTVPAGRPSNSLLHPSSTLPARPPRTVPVPTGTTSAVPIGPASSRAPPPLSALRYSPALPAGSISRFVPSIPLPTGDVFAPYVEQHNAPVWPFSNPQLPLHIARGHPGTWAAHPSMLAAQQNFVAHAMTAPTNDWFSLPPYGNARPGLGLVNPMATGFAMQQHRPHPRVAAVPLSQTVPFPDPVAPRGPVPVVGAPAPIIPPQRDPSPSVSSEGGGNGTGRRASEPEPCSTVVIDDAQELAGFLPCHSCGDRRPSSAPVE